MAARNFIFCCLFLAWSLEILRVLKYLFFQTCKEIKNSIFIFFIFSSQWFRKRSMKWMKFLLKLWITRGEWRASKIGKQFELFGRMWPTFHFCYNNLFLWQWNYFYFLLYLSSHALMLILYCCFEMKRFLIFQFIKWKAIT